jgi:alpha-1,6-mannosyltransferase
MTAAVEQTRAAGARPLTFLDMSTFYCRTAGGVRTYHQAKIDWFAKQHRHRYVLVVPGPCYRRRVVSPTVTIIEVYGLNVSGSPDGYRLLADYWLVRAIIARERPDVVETGDPWLSGPFGLLIRHRHGLDALLTAFYHTDPIHTYLHRWTRRRGALPGPRARVSKRASDLFYQVQRQYDATLVTSHEVEHRLRSHGVTRVVRVPFGVDRAWIEGEPQVRREPPDGTRRPARLLYAGRLDAEKGIELLLAAMPVLLAKPDVALTVIGKGRFQRRFEQFSHPRFRYAGFVEDRETLARIYADHDVLLAPGPYETFGLGVLEGLSAGLVVVGAEAGGTGELLRRLPDAYLFRPDDVRAFIETVDAACRADRAAAADAGRRLARSYGSWPDAIARQVAIYAGLMEDRSCRPDSCCSPSTT